MRAFVLALFLILLPAVGLHAQDGPNLCPDPSIEETQPPNQFGIPFKVWGGYKFEGAVEFRNGQLARTGNTCAEMVGAQNGKIRLYSPHITVDPGRYRFSCYIRGLDIGMHPWHICEDLNFADDKYYTLLKQGTFGWTKVEIVKQVPQKQEIYAAIGLWAPGRLWVDDAAIVRVPDATPLTPAPVLGKEEAPIAPPGPLDPATAIHCPECGYRNMPAWGRCYACGALLSQAGPAALAGPPVKLLASFEDGSSKPFDGGTPVAEHATDGKYSLRVDKDWVSWDGPQDWTGYDFLKVDAFNPSESPQDMYVELRDKETRDYWNRVNYSTVLPPGPSTLIVPTDIYVGEKSRPGRPLDKAHVTRVVLNIGDTPRSPVYFDNVRLERDLSDSVKVPGLQAYDFGPEGAKPFPGFIGVNPGTTYSVGRGYGLKNAQIWRAFDALQPDPLYETFICIENGGFATDVPDGRYHVWVNIDSPSGFWGEVQTYRERTIKANGKVVLHETMDKDAFIRRYFRFADVDDTPDENTFDKYQIPYFNEKEFDVDVTGGQLFIEFQGQNWANCVSAMVIYPASQADAGQRYLKNLRERRRFYFDNYFKRILPNPHPVGAGPEVQPNAEQTRKGYVLFSRDWMKDVSVNAIPAQSEVTAHLNIFASAGQMQPIVFSLYPLRDRGLVTVKVSALQSGKNMVPASDIELGLVSYRITRVTPEGTVYTISPRFIMPKASADIRKGTTTTFWLTLHTPSPVKAGAYTGKITLTFADGTTDSLTLSARIFSTPLDELDVPAGPWGCSIDLPWYSEDLGDYNQRMLQRCLKKLREYGCTTFSGIPTLRITGWKDHVPSIDFTTADAQMQAARDAGFRSMVVNYNGGIQGFNNYFIDNDAMKAAGFTNYVDFLKAILTSVDDHAKQADWLPVAYNLCDEPLGDDVARSAANAAAWRQAAPGDMLTTGATSMESPRPDDPHIPLAQALKIPDLNGHDQPALKLIHDAGNGWGFYNDGNRWTYGVYMYKCAKQYGMKFRLSWHFNASAGDPYYALDCREDDYSWVATNAHMDLIPAVHFDPEIRAGIDDYRYMQTLARLCKEHPNSPAAIAGQKLIDNELASFKLGDRDPKAPGRVAQYQTYQLSLAEAIDKIESAR